MEESHAKETLQECPTAAGVYDRMPFASAAAVWTLDTSTEIFLLHSFQVCYADLAALLGKRETNRGFARSGTAVVQLGRGTLRV